MEFLLILWLGAAILAAAIANAKNRSVIRWFFLTLLFGGIPFIFIIFLPTVQPLYQIRPDDRTWKDGTEQ